MAIINADWLNQNSQRAYPFQENMQCRPTVDDVLLEDYRIPNDTILDMVMATASFNESPRIYLSNLTFARNIITIAISDASTDEVLATASAVVSGDDQTPVNFFGIGKHDDIRGTIVFGNLLKVADKLPDGIYSFTSSETLFEARCVRPTVPCVSGLYISNVNGSNESVRLRGDVALVAGRNVKLEYDEEDNAIIIHATSDSNYNDSCECEFQDTRNVVKTVNGISVENVIIEGDGQCVEVETEDGRIKISDTCSKPCCGCAELTFLNEKTNEITTAQMRLSNLAENLSSRMTDFSMNVLLSDRGTASYM